MNDEQIKFIDLFAGIGGIRLAFEREGYKCVFSSEINEHACAMYKENFNEDSYCDITKLDVHQIPDFDVLCAGFPCQAFSISGKQKGFYDDTRGTLFFDICRILEVKKPRAFLLENVKNLEKHDKGNTLRIMLESLHKLGYSVQYKILNAKDFNTPQNRERIIIVGNRIGKFFDFDKVKKNPVESMEKFLDKTGDFEYLKPNEYTIIDCGKRQPSSGLIFIGYRNKKMRTIGVRPGTEHLSRVHKQPNRIYSIKGIHPTIASQETSGRYFIYDGSKVRKLTLNECYRFMGFPENFKKIGSKANLYERIGNSVCINMVEEVAKQIKTQIFGGDDIMDDKEINPMEFLEKIYDEVEKINDFKEIGLNEKQLKYCQIIADYEETLKGVFTALISSLTYKCLNPGQDVRYHKIELKNGYSGRSFDTKYVTPFLKSKQFYGAMKESGWLTRSIEQPYPFTLDFPGKINNKNVKNAFLQILNDVEVNKVEAVKYLTAIMKFSLINKSKKSINIINPIEREEILNIKDILEFLKMHFYYKYSSRGASILPVIAIYSIYECIMNELKRFENKKLDNLGSHNSSDKSSGEAGDIVVRSKKDNELYEVVEVKFDIAPTELMVLDAYKKIKNTKIQRYYILSTVHCNDNEQEKINILIEKIKKEHGCQVIVNGVFDSLKYYLRLINNTDDFINYYVKNLKDDTEINFEHKIAWNRIVNGTTENIENLKNEVSELWEESEKYNFDTDE